MLKILTNLCHPYDTEEPRPCSGPQPAKTKHSDKPRKKLRHSTPQNVGETVWNTLEVGPNYCGFNVTYIYNLVTGNLHSVNCFSHQILTTVIKKFGFLHDEQLA